MTTRRMLLQGFGLALAPALPRSAGAADRPPPDVGRKFAADGRVMPFKGNTVLCHLPQQGADSEAFDALLDLYRRFPAESWTRKMTALPPSSYHMTVFGGANDRDRQRPRWPADLPPDLPMTECDRILGERLSAFRLGEDGPPYRMRVDPAAPDEDETPLTLRLLPADTATERRLRRLRDRLAAVLGIREPGHASYRFHITLGYLFATLSTDEDEAFRRTLVEWKTQVAQRVPTIRLGAPEFCLLDDMFAFKRQFYLG